MTITFRNYQNDAIDFILDRSGANAFMEPGLGKTLISLETMANTEGPHLVIAPLLVAKNTWPHENKKWGYDFDMRVLHGKHKHLDTIPDISVINYEGMLWLRDELRGRENPFRNVVYDEISKMKSPGTRRFKNWRAQAMKFQTRLGLTGTPVGNHLLDLWGQMYCIDGGASLGRSIERYQRDFFRQVTMGRDGAKVWRPFQGVEDEIIDLIKPYARSWTTDLLDMPSLTYIDHTLALPRDAVQMYEEMKVESTLTDHDMIAVNSGVRSGKLRQMASGAVYDPDGNIVKIHREKEKRLKELLEELQGAPLLIVFEFDHDFDAITRAVGNRPFGVLHGATTERQAQSFISRWNEGELSALAIHPKSASYGLNLQGSANQMCFYTMPWSFELARQCLGRLWRQGQEKPVIVHSLLVERTKDFEVRTSLERKNELHETIMDGLK